MVTIHRSLNIFKKVIKIYLFGFSKTSQTEISCICGNEEQFSYISETPLNNVVITYIIIIFRSFIRI